MPQWVPFQFSSSSRRFSLSILQMGFLTDNQKDFFLSFSFFFSPLLHKTREGEEDPPATRLYMRIELGWRGKKRDSSRDGEGRLLLLTQFSFFFSLVPSTFRRFPPPPNSRRPERLHTHTHVHIEELPGLWRGIGKKKEEDVKAVSLLPLL